MVVTTDTPADRKQTDSHPDSSLTMFGVFPELAAIEFGEQGEAVKQLGSESVEKQLEVIEGRE